MDGVNGSEPLKSRHDRRVLLGLAAMTVVALIAAFWITRATNPLRGDSYEYLYFDASRPVGYPAFLALVRLVTGDVVLAVPAQILLLAGSLLILSWSFHKFFERQWLSFAFHTILIGFTAMWGQSALLIAEAISTALVAIWCAQLLRMIRATPSLRGVAVLVTVTGLATMVRPSLVTLFIGTALFLLIALPPRDRLRALMLTGAGLILSLGATPIARLLIYGSASTTSPVARGVLQHTLFCPLDTVPRDADSRFVEQSAAPVRRYIEAAPPEMQAQLRGSYSTLLRFGLIIPVLGRRYDLTVRSQTDPYLGRIASERVKANPSCYARSVIAEYARMAIFDTELTKQDARRFNRYIEAHPPVVVPQYARLPGDEYLEHKAAAEVRNRISRIQPRPQDLKGKGRYPLMVTLPIQLLFGGAALFGLLSLLALPFQKRLAPQLRQIIPATAAMGIAFHTMLAITAIVEIGLLRYLVPVWPIVCTLFAVCLVGLIDAWRAARRKGRLPA